MHMIKKRKTSTKSAKAEVVIPQVPMMMPAQISQSQSKRKVIIGLALLLLAGFLYMKKQWFVAAVVDGQPIFTWDLNAALRAQYGSQTLESMIGEKLITKEAKKNNIELTTSDIDAKKQEILSSLGPDVKLEDLLKYQGMTEADFEKRLRMQMTVEKILTKDLVISDSDIDSYIASNRATLAATEPAKMREEARAAIVSNSVSEKIQTWFSEIRQKAKIMTFL